MKRRMVLAGAAATALLAACGKEGAKAPGGSNAAAAPGSAAVSLEKIEAEAKGFNVGSTMNQRTLYVFFDAQCPHCAVMWDAAKPLKPQARFVWIPVGLLGDKSFSQGGAILAAGDPVAAMDQHELSMRNKQGGITAVGVAEAQKEIVRKNTQLFTSFGLNGVPAIVGKHAQTGQLVTVDGSLPAAALAQRFGLQAPGG
ncbi:MAG TPA: thioredoxin fold domain-containing protein [Ramlibacter sp.]|jgi:thiol:disulfide interchange protein DsbG|nr:thioredoxin fold domain-containing protein [Ramlibacter sp.]